MADAHQDPRFANAATYQVAVTVTIAGGARPRTAHRRVAKVAERIVTAAARAADVIDAHGQVGPPDLDGNLSIASTVRFAAANTGRGTHHQPTKLSRYLDPDHERALVSLAEANRRDQRRRDADRDRRRRVGCVNTSRLPAFCEPWACGCVYCEPDLHRAAVDDPADTPGEPPRCVCGRLATACRDHDGIRPVALDGDPASLHELAEIGARRTDGGRP